MLSGSEFTGIERHEEWLFNDAPRSFRIEGVEKLPELFAKLIQEAEQATISIRAKTELAKDLSSAINDAAAELAAKRKAAERRAAKAEAVRRDANAAAASEHLAEARKKLKLAEEQRKWTGGEK